MSTASQLPILPPSYAEPGPQSSGQLDLEVDDSALPSYFSIPTSSSTAHNYGTNLSSKDYSFEIRHKGKLFSVLTIVALDLPNTMPTFVGDHPIKGTVRLLIEKEEAFREITLRIQGKLISCGQDGTGGGGQIVFIEIPHTIWSKSMGDPRHSASKYTPVSPLGDPKEGRFLAGEYIWNFSIELPREVVLSPGHRHSKTFQLPQSFAERFTRASISYSAALKISTPSILRPSSDVVAPIGYISAIQPPPLPPLRQQSYEEGSPLLPPSFDPEGWHACQPQYVKGKLFKHRSVEVECKLYLANPLVYTKGTVIPMYLELSSTDSQALSLFASPKAIVCRLRRTIKQDDAGVDRFRFTFQEGVTLSQHAIWWKSDHEPADSKVTSDQRACLMGELQLTNTLKPTTALSWFEINYSVILFPFNAVGFEPGKSAVDHLVVEPVKIANTFAPGPRPRMTGPPGYATEVAMYQQAPALARSEFGFM